MKSIINPALLFSVALILLACGNDNSDNSSADSPPVANAIVIGTPLINNVYTVLAGTDVLISGKDSEGIDDPILQFNWSASHTSDNSLSLNQITDSLYERTNTTKLFKVPAVLQETQVTFELTVVDADDVEAKDSIIINIIPFAKTRAFLNASAVTNSKSNQYELVVALALEPNEVTASEFEILIETIAQWDPRTSHDSCTFGPAQNQCQLVIEEQTVIGDWPPGLSYDDAIFENSATAYFNPHFLIDIPSLDIDLINRNFETSDRNKRLELHQTKNAFLTQRFSFVFSDNTARIIILNSVKTAESDLINHSSNSTTPSSVEADQLRDNQGIESQTSATAYYQLIDPNSDVDTLEKWLNLRGFYDSENNISSIDHAIYTNNYDLGFGRDMFMRTDKCGNVYSYVDNYPTLENAIQKRNNFATVIMEYSSLQPQTGDSCNEGDKFVKFYAYAPDETTGEIVRTTSMNFDGRGEKFLPGVCTSCHRGSPDTITQFISGLAPDADASTEINNFLDEQRLALADLNATFMPFDLDAFLYTDASDEYLIDPVVYNDTLTNEQITQYARETQESNFDNFNKAVLHTYLHKQNSLEGNASDQERWQAPIDLINTWYDSEIATLADINEFGQNNFNGQNVLPQWQDEENLYHDVFAKYCRACHIQAPDLTLNFDSSSKFIAAASKIAKQVYTNYNMPMARLTSDRFWLDFNGDDPGATILQTFLENHDQTIEPFTGSPKANFTITDTVSNAIISEIDEINQLITFDASDSVYAEDYQWSLTNDCASNSFLIGSTSSQASLINDISPCIYSIQLDVSNFFGQDSLIKTLVVDRSPQAVPVNILINNTNSDLPPIANIGADTYTPGDSTLDIDIDSKIIDRGDNDGDNLTIPLQLIILEVSNDNLFVDNNNDGTLTITFPPLSGINSIIKYQVADFNNSMSDENEKGIISLDIKAIIPTLTQQDITSNSVSLSWTVPDNFEAQSYTLYRSSACDSCTETIIELDGQTTSYTDSDLNSSTNYQYEVEAMIFDDTTRSDVLEITTSSGKPSGLVVSQSINALSLSWNMESQADPTEFNIYRSTGNDTSPLLLLDTLDGSARSFDDEGLTANSYYNYQVQAVFSNADTADSAIVTSYTLMAAPSSLSVSNITENSVLLSWADNNGDEDLCFIINNTQEQCITDVASYQYQLNSLTSNTPYTFTVKAKGINGQGSTTTSSSQRTTKVSYVNDVYPLVLTSLDGAVCTGCHKSGVAEAAFSPYDGNNLKNSNALLTELLRTSFNGPQKKYKTIIGCITNGCDDASTMSDSMGAQTSPFNNTQKALYEKWVAENPSL